MSDPARMAADFLRILFTVLIVMDPIGIIPQFLSLTAGYDEKTRKSIIVKAVFIAGIVLMVFLLVGKLLLNFFGIMPGAFYISGGILFFLIAFEMIYSRPGHRSIPAEDGEGAGNAGNLIALFPLAIPLIAGPGLLTVIIMFITSGDNWLYSFCLLFPAILIGLFVAFVTLRCSTLLLGLLGSTGIFVMEKIMGLILSGFAVQFIYNGLAALGLIQP
ncbi:MAG: MarC family protein [Treponema sp.]|jgi:multiple antibiotic resistance protein|nr:MarC family protein [Treponema sp.]